MKRLHLFGSLGLVDEDGAELRPVLAQPKRLALLVHLALAEPAGFQRRDRLLALFWPEADTESARRALRQSLHFLRQHLGTDTLPGRGDDEIGLAPGALWCDAVAFREALAAGRTGEALDLYRGELLAGFHVRDAAPEFDEWLEAIRGRFRQAALGAARMLARADEDEGNYVRALRWARRALELSPDDPAAVRAVMRLDEAVGDPQAALETCAAYARRRLDAGLGEPDRETLALADRIRREQASAPAAAPAPPAPAAPPPSPVEPAASAAAAPVVAPPGTALPRRRWPLALAGAAALLVMVATLARSRLPADGAAAPEAPSLAVLPFSAVGGDTTESYFAEGIADELTNRLSQVASLAVRPMDASRQAVKDGKPATVAARELGVRYVVTGDVRRAAGRVMVNARLVDGTTGAQRWGASFDQPRDSVFAVQEQIVLQVARSLRATLSPAEAARVAAVPTRDSIAHNLYLIGMQQYAHFTGPEMQRARASLTRAIERDPNYEAALFSLGRVYLAMSAGYGQVPPQEGFPRVREMADRILALDPTSGDGMMLRGTALAWYDWDWGAAEREYLRGIAAAPAHSELHGIYAILLQMTGRSDSAMAQVTRSLAIDPLSTRYRTNRIMHHMMAGRYDACLAAADQVFELDPNFAQAMTLKAACYALLGRRDEAVAQARQTLQVARGTPRILGETAAALALAGARDDARRILEELVQRSRTGWIDPGAIAVGYAALGDRDAARTWLEQAISVRSRWVIHLGVDPRFDPVRGEPWYQAMLERVGLSGVRGGR